MVLIARFGQFSHLWVDMCHRLGFEVQVLECEWGEGAPLDRYQAALAADTQHRIKAVLATHNETATGVTSDIAGIRRAMDSAGHPAFLFVDAVSSLGSIDFRMDEWKVDVCVSGSQKGLMLPRASASPASARRRWKRAAPRPASRAATSTTSTCSTRTRTATSRTRRRCRCCTA